MQTGPPCPTLPALLSEAVTSKVTLSRNISCMVLENTHIILLGSPPEVGASCIAGNVEHSNPLQTGQRDWPPIALHRNEGNTISAQQERDPPARAHALWTENSQHHLSNTLIQASSCSFLAYKSRRYPLKPHEPLIVWQTWILEKYSCFFSSNRNREYLFLAWQNLLIYFSRKQNKTPETSMWWGSSPASYLFMLYMTCTKVFLFQLDTHYSIVKFRAFHCTHHLKWCAHMYYMEHNNLIHDEHCIGNSKYFPAGWYFFPYGLRIQVMLQNQEKPLLVTSRWHIAKYIFSGRQISPSQITMPKITVPEGDGIRHPNLRNRRAC